MFMMVVTDPGYYHYYTSTTLEIHYLLSDSRYPIYSPNLTYTVLGQVQHYQAKAHGCNALSFCGGEDQIGFPLRVNNAVL